MSTFNHLHVPHQWEHYWSKYPQGYTIMEALLNWVNQVDNMVDNQNQLNDKVEEFRNELDAFINQFDDDLIDQVQATLTAWQEDGTLDVIISDALQTQIDEVDDRLTPQMVTTMNYLSDLGVSLKDNGLVGDGETDETTAMLEVIDYVASEGGGRIFGDKTATYLITSDITITTSNVEIDMQGATLIGYHRFIFEGTKAAPLKNCVFKNARVGDGTGQTRATKFTWCEDSYGENIVKDGPSGTAFNIHFCKRTFFKNCVNKNSKKDEGGGIGYLIHLSDDCQLDNCHALDGPFIYAYQVKGGNNNKVIDCSGKNIRTDVIEPAHIFRDRGDAPWSESQSDGEYPFDDKGWIVHDDRRASHNTQFIRCTVENCDGNAFSVQEAIGTSVISPRVDNVESGVRMVKTAEGKEADFLLTDFIIRNVTDRGLFVNSIDGVTNKITGVDIGDGLIVGTGNNGIRLAFCDQPTLRNIEIRDSSPEGVLIADNTTSPFLENVVSSNNGDWDIFIDNTTLTPTALNCEGEQLKLDPLGVYQNIKPSYNQEQSVDDSWVTTALRLTMSDGQRAWIEFQAIAESDDSTDKAIFKIGGLFACNNGVVEMVNDTTETISNIKTTNAANWDIKFQLVDEVVRGYVKGDTGMTVNWDIFVDCTIV